MKLTATVSTYVAVLVTILQRAVHEKQSKEHEKCRNGANMRMCCRKERSAELSRRSKSSIRNEEETRHRQGTPSLADDAQHRFGKAMKGRRGVSVAFGNVSP